MITVYGIKNCDTVKKACRWLDEAGIDYIFHDFKKSGISADLARNWIDTFGLETVINKRGTTYRKLDDVVKSNLSVATAVPLIIDQNSVVKRPILTGDQGSLIGFSSAQYQEFFSK